MGKSVHDLEEENASLRNRIPPPISWSSRLTPQTQCKPRHFDPNGFLMPYLIPRLYQISFSQSSYRVSITLPFLQVKKLTFFLRGSGGTLWIKQASEGLTGIETWVFQNPNDKLTEINLSTSIYK